MVTGNGQHEIKESFYHLDICCQYVAQKFGKPNIREWTNGDYVRLSSILSRATAVQISSNTLKRISGKLKTTERYYPQKATRDALVQYAGYTDWEHFVRDHPRPLQDDQKKEIVVANQQQEPVLVGNIPPAKRTPVAKRRNWRQVAIFLACIMIIGAFIIKSTNQPAIDPRIAQFTCSNPEGLNPHSAVFKLVIPKNFRGDRGKYTIDFGDGKRELQITDGLLLTHYYEIPGRYYAYLKYDGAKVDTIPIYLKSNGWTATARMERDSIRVYPVNDLLVDDRFLSASTMQLLHSGVDTNRTFFVDFVNTSRMNVDGDNFELVGKVNTSSDRPGVRCSQLQVFVFGEKSQHQLLLLKPGCEAWANLQFSDFSRDGKKDDLSFLSADLSGGGILTLRVVKKKVSFLINEKEVYTARYNYPLENIYGVKVSFSGVGTIHDITLKDLVTGASFQNAFTQ